ncbi:amino acid ABC transporter permease [Paraliobacillus ryukyuensis]|uniref:amino acid ABC transporter permease n=1 Tax=Paraliobacillus ryukyuensis TaxID=200904 RepID=UPI0009A8BCD4|nr:amino acid ABC transporter permease [Paraliobacillus ryukyuensis]
MMHTEITPTKSKVLPPEKKQTIFGWTKKNLFNSWFNVILTFVSLFIIFIVLKGTLTWVVTNADWEVIRANYQLFMVGQFSEEEIWRVWSALLYLTLLFGLSAGVWKGTIRQLSFLLTGIYVIHLALPFLSGHTKIWLLSNIVTLFASYVIGLKIPKGKMIGIGGWLFSIIVIVFFLQGFGILPSVKTSMWNGLLLTVILSAVAIVGSFPIGILLALGRTSKLPIIKYFCIAYIEFIRGIPLITVFFSMQILIPLFLPEGFTVANIIRVMIGATLFTAAYMAENVRGGLQSIPKGQFEAAKTIGLSSIQSIFLIILPQALRAVIPAIVGQSISMFKDTSLVAIVGLVDLLGIAQTVKSNPAFLGHHMEVYLFVALVYWVIAYAMSYSSRRLEETLGVGKR